MEKITQITESDIGRVAVSKDGEYRVKILGLSNLIPNKVRVEYLAGSNYDNGRLVGRTSEAFNLAINGGGKPMYWEGNTPFTNWCTENGYDPKGEFVYTKKSSIAVTCSYFHIQDKLKLFNDDGTCCPKFVNQDGKQAYENFNKPYCRLVQVLKNKAAKPRFRKTRKKPPVRKKTDVVIHYKTGQTYTLKNVNSVSVSAEKITIGVVKEIEEGIRIEVNNDIDPKLVGKITVKAPECETEIHNYGDNEFVVYFGNGYGIVRQWLKNF